MFQILHCMVHYIDISSPSSSVLNSELIHVISKHVEVTYSAPEYSSKDDLATFFVYTCITGIFDNLLELKHIV